MLRGEGKHHKPNSLAHLPPCPTNLYTIYPAFAIIIQTMCRYDAIIDLTRKLNSKHKHPKQTQEATKKILKSLFPGWLPGAFSVRTHSLRLLVCLSPCVYIVQRAALCSSDPSSVLLISAQNMIKSLRILFTHSKLQMICVRYLTQSCSVDMRSCPSLGICYTVTLLGLPTNSYFQLLGVLFDAL